MTSNSQPAPLDDYFNNKQRFTQILDEMKLITKFVRALAYWLSLHLSLPIDVFLHRRIGERHLYGFPVLFTTILTVLSGTALSMIFTIDEAVGLQMRSRTDPSIQQWANWTAFAFFIAACIQTGFIMRRRNQGEQWHSRSPGVPWGFWTRIPRIGSSERVRQFVEPAAVAILGLVLFWAGVRFGAFFLVSAIALVSREYIQYRHMREQLLDRLDAQIEAENWEMAVERATEDPTQTQGFVVPGMNQIPLEQRRSMAEDLALLEPKTNSIVATRQ